MHLLAHNLRTVDDAHVGPDLVGDGPGDHGLPGPGGAVEQHSSGRRDSCGETEAAGVSAARCPGSAALWRHTG